MVQEKIYKKFIGKYNCFLKEYYKNKNIQLIYSRARHSSTNGVVESIHKDIKSLLLAEKLKNNKSNNLNLPK